MNLQSLQMYMTFWVVKSVLISRMKLKCLLIKIIHPTNMILSFCTGLVVLLRKGLKNWVLQNHS